MILGNINPSSSIIWNMVVDVAASLTPLGALDMHVATTFWKRRWRLMGTTRDSLISRLGKVTRSPSSEERSIGFEHVVKCFEKDTGIEEAAFRRGNCPAFVEPLQRETFIRYLFSALTDSDWLSTERHFDQDVSEIRVSPKLPIRNDRQIGEGIL